MPSPNDTLLQKYAAQLPRYTSYPTAPHFLPIGADSYATWIRDIPQNAPLSLYLHIPYCQKLCWFCGCHTKISHDYASVASYLEALHEEIALTARLTGEQHPVSHVHFGGGSPTILRPEDFARVMKLLHTHFLLQPSAEIAIEIDPRTADEPKIKSYAHFGVNRISIGVQDFDPTVQAAINREQSYDCVFNVVRLAREHGIRHVNLDLIYGLPKQTLAGFLATLEQTVQLNPSRISLFGYAHVPVKKKSMQLIDIDDLPDAALRFALFAQASEYLATQGYLAVGLDHFVRPEDSMAHALETRTLQRNFQGYTTDDSRYLLGLGASAISSLPQGYAQNTPDIEEYKRKLTAGSLTTQRGFTLTPEDWLRRTIIETLMCYFEADIKSLAAPYGVAASAFDTVFAKLLPLAEDGIIEIKNYFIKIHNDFPQAVRLVCAEFDAYFIPHKNQHAQVA